MPAERSDEELMELWRGGGADAGDELFSRHFEALYRFFSNEVDRRSRRREAI